MLTNTYLDINDLVGLIDGIWAYNKKGQVTNVMFYDVEGKPLQVSWIGVMSEEQGLTVRMKPEDINSVIKPNVDPRLVSQPLSVEELSKL